MQNPRTEKTLQAYQEFQANQQPSKNYRQFNFIEETVIAEYEHWLIIKNRFPYDTMVRVNDMLVSKRAVPLFANLTQAEKSEYESILTKLADSKSYDAKIENFPHVKSVTDHVHIHLVCWHNTDPK